METLQIFAAVALFGVAMLIAVRSLQSGADGQYKSVGWFGRLAAFAAALWTALTIL